MRPFLKQEIILYPGCLSSQEFPEYESSANQVLTAMGFAVIEHPLPLCCGSTVFESVDDDYKVLPAAILAAASGVPIVTLCGSCTQTLTRAIRDFVAYGFSPKISARLADAGLNMPVNPEVIHIAIFIHENLDKLEGLKKRTLNGQAAVIVPCQIARPTKLWRSGFHDVKQKVEQAVRWTGLDVIDYEQSLDCCGATLALIDAKAAKKAAKSKFGGLPEHAMIVDACANCRTAYLRAHECTRESKAYFLTELILEAIGKNA